MAIVENGNATFVGCVISLRERNMHDDSDFFALVWDEESQSLREIMYGTTRFAGGGGAMVDATEEVKAKAAQWAYKNVKKIYWTHYIQKRSIPQRGDTVKIARGKSEAKGKEGILFWLGETKTYGGPSSWSQKKTRKVGVALSQEKDSKGNYLNVAWTYDNNLDVNLTKKIKYSEAKNVVNNCRKNAVYLWNGHQAYGYLAS